MQNVLQYSSRRDSFSRRNESNNPLVEQVLDVDNVDLAMGKVLDEGPVLAVTFQAQMIDYTTNAAGDVSCPHSHLID